MDPLARTLALAMEQLFNRGWVVTPVGDGWLVKVAPVEHETESWDESYRRDNGLDRSGRVRRSW